MEKLLEIKNMSVSFEKDKKTTKIVRNINLSVNRGEILAIVGESGSGKSVTVKSLMSLLPEYAHVEADGVYFDGRDIMEMSPADKRKIYGKDISMIFQDPMTALNPLKKIGSHLIEVIKRHQKISTREAKILAVKMLQEVGIAAPEERMKQYPHEFSGGMRQRVLIAMALCSHPKLLIADEPTTALDVTIQAQILKLLKNLHKKEDMDIILITHDLGVVASVADRIAVMYGGRIMEQGTKEEILYDPKHPYTKALLKAIPKSDTARGTKLEAIAGSIPSFADLGEGCPFADRCEYASVRCKNANIGRNIFSETHSSSCVLKEIEKVEQGA